MHADGNSVSAARSRCTLFSRSAIIKQTSQASEFFNPLLQSNIHYLPVAHDFHDLKAVLLWARKHDDVMQAMALRTRAWAEIYMLDDSVMCYVSLLLHRYQALQTFMPVLTPEMLQWRVMFPDMIRGWISSETGMSCMHASRYVDPNRQT